MSELEGVLGLAGETVPEGVWPNADEQRQPWTLFAPDLKLLLESCLRKRRSDHRNFHSLKKIEESWQAAVLSLPATVFSETSLLKDLFAFGQDWDWEFPPFRETVEQVASLLQPDTVQRALPAADADTAKVLWESVRMKKPRRDSRSIGGSSKTARCIAELINKGLPRWCWAGHLVAE